MIRIYIIAADTIERASFTVNRKPGEPARAQHALLEVVELRDLANPERMRALATEFHQHFKGHAR